ncbi:MAG: hypothetical protein VZR28_10605, partial [Candidatus Cryptobacteroides sp.]|nr:hypothetical protein [Candidatus Cryptobacteroides sp.]
IDKIGLGKMLPGTILRQRPGPGADATMGHFFLRGQGIGQAGSHKKPELFNRQRINTVEPLP